MQGAPLNNTGCPTKQYRIKVFHLAIKNTGCPTKQYRIQGVPLQYRIKGIPAKQTKYIIQGVQLNNIEYRVYQ